MHLLISCADSLLNSLQSLTTEVSNLRQHNLHMCRENAVSHVKTCVSEWERERKLESAEASSTAVIGRLASAPLPWVQWLSSRSVLLVIRRAWVWIPVDFLSLSLKSVHLHHVKTVVTAVIIIWFYCSRQSRFIVSHQPFACGQAVIIKLLALLLMLCTHNNTDSNKLSGIVLYYGDTYPIYTTVRQ